jgi:hypothetical protein
VELVLTKLIHFHSPGGASRPEWQTRLALAALAAKYYPEARRYLRDHGYKAEQLDAMPAVQVVVLYQTEQYDQYRDEIVKLLSLPAWQARAGMETVGKEIGRLRMDAANVFVGLLFPAVLKVHEAQVRLERTVAGLRCGEALRLYAAAHDGKAPDRFTDITNVPLPPTCRCRSTR